MEWSTCNSNNENGLLKANGPYRLQTTGDFLAIVVLHPRIIELNKPILVGDVRIYGTGIQNEGQPAKNATREAK